MILKHLKYSGVNVALCSALFVLGCGQKEHQTFEPQPEMIPAQQIGTLPIGGIAPDFKLMGVDGMYHSLEDYRGSEALVVIFTDNVCPYAQVYDSRIKNFVEEYRSKGVSLIAINTNSPLTQTEEDRAFSDLSDDYPSMVARAEQEKFNYPYLYDGDNHRVALQYGPTALPHAFVFDQNLKLQYQGSLDFNSKPGTANLDYIRIAVDAIKEHRAIIRKERTALGCKVNWSWLHDRKHQADSLWSAKPVTMQDITIDSLKTLLVNFGTKGRMINFWATWCGPCKQEFPELMKIQRRFGNRSFELITISLDESEKYDEALMFLKQIHAPTTNFFLDAKDKKILTEEIFPFWDGSLPFSIILEPYGETYKVYQGAIDPSIVKKDILDYRLMGRYPHILI